MQALCDTLQSIQTMLFQRFGTGILTDEPHTMAFLRDQLAGDQRNLNRMRLFYESGANDVLQQTSLPPTQRARRAALTYADYTDCPEQLAQTLMDTILTALGRKPETELELREEDRGEDMDALVNAAIEEVMADMSESSSSIYELPWKYTCGGRTDPYPILRAAMEWKGVWVAWEAERYAILARRLDDGHHFCEYKRLVELCQKTAPYDPDCMRLLAEWYQDGLTTLDYSGEQTLVEKDPDQASAWRIKEAAARRARGY